MNNKQEWIEAAQLPELDTHGESDTVIICIVPKSSPEDYYSMMGYYVKNKGWYAISLVGSDRIPMDVFNVTHWMPKPDRPDGV